MVGERKTNTRYIHLHVHKEIKARARMDGYTREKSGMGASGCVRRFEGRDQLNITYTIEITLKGYWAIHSYTRQGKA